MKFSDGEGGLVLYSDQKKRLIVLEHVDGESVIIGVSAAPEKFDRLLPEAQEVLDTVEWKGA